MDYSINTHCPNCFQLNSGAICPHCHFNREDDSRHIHHLSLFTRLNKSYVIGRVLGESGFAIVYAALREFISHSFFILDV